MFYTALDSLTASLTSLISKMVLVTTARQYICPNGVGKASKWPVRDTAAIYQVERSSAGSKNLVTPAAPESQWSTQAAYGY